MYNDRITLTMQDILEKEFKIDARGYRLQEVDKFLDVIIKDYNEYNNIIKSLEKEKRELSQREISKTTNLSLGTVNKTITSLLEKKLINEDNTITKRGLKELEPYRVKRAIFLAAGFGSRLVPITLNTPKPLVLVNGKKIISSIEAARIGEKEITNVDLLRRISQLEKIILGKEQQ